MRHLAPPTPPPLRRVSVVAVRRWQGSVAGQAVRQRHATLHYHFEHRQLSTGAEAQERDGTARRPPETAHITSGD